MNLKKIMSGAAAFMMTASLMTSYPTGCFKGLVIPVSVGAEELNFCGKTENDKVYWSFDSATGTLTISGSGEMKDFSIDEQPEWYENYISQVKSIIISEGVTSIGNYAFSNMKYVDTVVIPSSTIISDNSFNACWRLCNITFTSYTSTSRSNVKLIETIMNKVSGNKANFTYTGSCGPNATYTLDSQGNLEISGSGDISSKAFQGWTNITKVVIGDEITYIGTYAFDNCTGIDNIKIGEKVFGIGSFAINCCNSLKSIVFPNSVYSVSNYFIANCKNLTSITAQCKLKTALSSYKDKVTYTHPNINEKCECNDCHETFHVDTDNNCICDECNTSIDHDTTANPNKCAVCGTEFVYITANGVKTRYTFGETATITAPPAETGMTFDCWTAPNGKVVSRDAEYTFNAVVDNTYTPNYTPSKSSETMTIVWLSAYGQEMKRVTDTEDNLKSVEEPNVPTRLGYETTGWEKKIADIPFESGTTVIINAVYKELPQTYRINVTNGTADKTEYTASQVATITADEKDGQKFSYWQEENGNIVSYSSTYKFYVSKNMKLTAVYDIVVEEPKGTADIVNSYYNSDTKKSIVVAQLTVPDGCKMVYAGLIATTKESVANSGLTKETASYIKGGENLSCKSYRYTWTVGNSKKATLYSRAYLVYTTTDNETKVIYSDTVDVCKP